MVRSLQKIGNSKGIVMTRMMLDHLGVTEEVEITLEKDQIILTAPKKRAELHRQHFEEAMEATFTQYDAALQRLADS